MKAQKRFWRMVRTVRVERRNASGTRSRSEETIVMPAVSMAMSLPPPMAIPRSASASAALSLMPSPTIATRRPRACNSRTKAAFSCGSTPAR